MILSCGVITIDHTKYVSCSKLEREGFQLTQDGLQLFKSKGKVSKERREFIFYGFEPEN